MAGHDSGPLAKHWVDRVYIPSSLIIFTVALIKIEYTPVAIAIAAALAGYNYMTHRARAVLDPVQYQEFPLVKKDTLSHNTAVYRFALPSADSILGLPIGQHISLAATLDVKDPKTGETDRREVVRSYTPISSDNDRGFFELLVKAYPTGNISRHLSTLEIGDKMRVKGPKGAMVYTPNMVRRFGMIAGGTGITPMLQVINAVVRGRKSGDRTEVDLIFANVNEDDILMREALEKLVKEDDKFRVHYVLNNPPSGWTGGEGFVTMDMIKKHLPPAADDVKILVCGPPPMVSAVKKMTESLGYQKARPVSKLEDQVFCF